MLALWTSEYYKWLGFVEEVATDCGANSYNHNFNLLIINNCQGSSELWKLQRRLKEAQFKCKMLTTKWREQKIAAKLCIIQDYM